MILGKPILRLLSAIAGAHTYLPAFQSPTLAGSGHTASLYASEIHGDTRYTVCYQAPSSYRGNFSISTAGFAAVAGLGEVLLCEQGGRLAARPSKGTTAINPPAFAAECTPPAWPLPPDLVSLDGEALAGGLKELLALVKADAQGRFPLWGDGGDLLATDGHRARVLPCNLGGANFAIDARAAHLLALALATLPTMGKTKDPENPKRSKIVQIGAWSVAVSDASVRFVGWSLDGSAQSLLVEVPNLCADKAPKPETIRRIVATTGTRAVKLDRDAILDLTRFYDAVALFDGPDGPSTIGLDAAEKHWGLYGPRPRMVDLVGTFHGPYLRALLPKSATAAKRFPAVLDADMAGELHPLTYQGQVVMPRRIGPTEIKLLEDVCKPTPHADGAHKAA